MVSRDESATVDLKVRMKEPLRASLEEAARRHGVSMNAEAVQRLERSFNEEDLLERVFGGAEVRGIVELVITGFTYHGEMAAHQQGRPEWKAAEWLKDPACYRAATLGVVETLIERQPEAQWEQAWYEIDAMAESIKSTIGSLLVRQGKLKFQFKGREAE